MKWEKAQIISHVPGTWYWQYLPVIWGDLQQKIKAGTLIPQHTIDVIAYNSCEFYVWFNLGRKTPSSLGIFSRRLAFVGLRWNSLAIVFITPSAMHLMRSWYRLGLLVELIMHDSWWAFVVRFNGSGTAAILFFLVRRLWTAMQQTNAIIFTL